MREEDETGQLLGVLVELPGTPHRRPGLRFPDTPKSRYLGAAPAAVENPALLLMETQAIGIESQKCVAPSDFPHSCPTWGTALLVLAALLVVAHLRAVEGEHVPREAVRAVPLPR